SVGHIALSSTERDRAQHCECRERQSISRDASLSEQLQMIAVHLAEVRAAMKRASQRWARQRGADRIRHILPGEAPRTDADQWPVAEHHEPRNERSESVRHHGVVI